MSNADFTHDELYSLATEADITPRSGLTKAELFEALEDEAPHLLEPFAVVHDLEVGDVVSMNHLGGNLTVTDVHEDDDGEYVAVVMETVRGGRHALIVPQDDHEVGKNGNDPHLRRWRAGDEEWMNNSTDPVFIRLVNGGSDEDEEDEDDSS